jgi:hypothetical protein
VPVVTLDGASDTPKPGGTRQFAAGTGQAPRLTGNGCYQWCMRRNSTALAALSLVLTGCASAPVAPPASAPPVATTGTSAAVPLDAQRFHYSAMRVTAISADSLAFSVVYPQGGGAQSSIGPGLGGASFGFRGSPSIEVGLTQVGGKPALVLQPGAIT